MKIAQIVCTFPPYKGGMGNSAYHFSKILKKYGHKITTFTPAINSIKQNLEKKSTIRLSTWLKYGKGAFMPQLFFKLKKFDIIYLHYPFFGTAEIIWLIKSIYRDKKKLIIHYHMDVAGLSFLAKLLSLPSKLICNSLFKQADIITCASIDYIKHSNISKFYKKNKHKFFEIPFGVDIDKFKPDTEKKESKIINILFVGSLDKAHYFKGINILLNTASILNSNNFKILIVGDGNLRQKYEKQSIKKGLKNKIKFLGKISDEELPKIYRKSDLFILPSINSNEAFGLVLLEAMASGIPVIASDLPGVRKVFQDGIHGLLAKPGDANDLKNKIESFLTDNKKIKNMGLAGRKLVKEKYSWLMVGKKLNKILEI